MLHVCVSNASDTEFHLFIALGKEIDMASLTFLQVNNICFVLKSFVWKNKLKELSLKSMFIEVGFFECLAMENVLAKRVNTPAYL